MRGDEYAILTNIIHQEWSGVSPPGLVADQALHIQVLKEVSTKKW